MSAASVMGRFLPLLDVTIILLGVLMLAIANMQIRTASKQQSDSAESTDQGQAAANRANINFVYLRAGCEGRYDGKCYTVDNEGHPLEMVRVDVPDDIDSAFEKMGGNPASNQVVLLMFPKGAWDSRWTEKYISEIEEAWGKRVVPAYNVDLPEMR